jgi:Family of unknown function (DUF6494)
MNEDVFNGSIRKFLKTLGVSAQREIEKAVRQDLAEGKLKGNEKFPATGTITLGGIGLSHGDQRRNRVGLRRPAPCRSPSRRPRAVQRIYRSVR